MSMTENRLHDAGTAATETLPSCDSPSRDAPGRRRTRVLTALGAVTALGVAGVAGGLYLAGTGHDRPVLGPGWHIAAHLPAGVEPHLTVATGPGRAWVFGGQGADSSEYGGTDSSRELAWQLSGGTLRPAPSPVQAGDSVDSAGASAPDNVWVATAGGRVLRWDGQSWQVIAGAPDLALTTLAVMGPTDVWEFGWPPHADAALTPGTLAWHYHDGQWTRVPSADGLSDPSIVSATDAWAADGTVVASWNGTTWTRTSLARLLPRQTSPGCADIVRVAAQSADGVWAASENNCGPGPGSMSLLHLTGGQWHLVATTDASPDALVSDGHGGAIIAEGLPSRGAAQFTDALLRFPASGPTSQLPLPAPWRVMSLVSMSSAGGTALASAELASGATASAAAVLSYEP